MDGATILIIEDDRELAEMVASYLRKEGGFNLIVCHDGLTGRETALECRPELIVLDLRLPGLKGIEVCRQLRKSPRTEAVPIIMLSSCSEEIDRVVSLEMGADDYVTKPFSPRELLLRIQAVLRRSASLAAVRIIVNGRIRIDLEQFTVKVDGRVLALSKSEYRLLTVLAEYAGRTLSRTEIMGLVWGDAPKSSTLRAGEVHVTRLRAKLGVVGDQVRTVIGCGYTMDPEPADHQ